VYHIWITHLWYSALTHAVQYIQPQNCTYSTYVSTWYVSTVMVYVCTEFTVYRYCVYNLYNRWCIKGPVSRKLSPMLLYIVISAFTAHFPLKVQGSFKFLSSACSILGKRPIRIWSLRWFFCTSFYERKMFDKLVPGNIWRCALVFERSLYDKVCVRFKCVHCSYNYFQVRCTPNSILWINPALSKGNTPIMLRTLNAIYWLAL